MADSIEKRVQDALNEIRPQLQMDGGDVQFVAVEGQTVKVHLVGHCAGCHGRRPARHDGGQSASA